MKTGSYRFRYWEICFHICLSGAAMEPSWHLAFMLTTEAAQPDTTQWFWLKMWQGVRFFCLVWVSVRRPVQVAVAKVTRMQHVLSHWDQQALEGVQGLRMCWSYKLYSPAPLKDWFRNNCLLKHNNVWCGAAFWSDFYLMSRAGRYIDISKILDMSIH